MIYRRSDEDERILGSDEWRTSYERLEGMEGY